MLPLSVVRLPGVRFRVTAHEPIVVNQSEDKAADTLAGITVAMVAIPLSLAIAIASGVPPGVGLVTAIVGGFLISALGGSRVQIGALAKGDDPRLQLAVDELLGTLRTSTSGATYPVQDKKAGPR